MIEVVFSPLCYKTRELSGYNNLLEDRKERSSCVLNRRANKFLVNRQPQNDAWLENVGKKKTAGVITEAPPWVDFQADWFD